MATSIPGELLLRVGEALLCAMVVSFLMSPLVKSFAYKIGAIDVPKDSRRMHKKPVPRLGGLAIFLGFLMSLLIFVPIDHQLQGILLGAVIIVVLGVVDDITPLRAWFKFIIQIVAALVAVYHGVVVNVLSNPNIFSSDPYWSLGWMSVPITVLWIVGITNSVNLIDGLDGLANGVSTISAVTMLVIALLVSEGQTALVMASLVGACVGFMPYNRNPAQMFMGDTGSTFLGYILATISIQGLFKYYAIISFAVPFLILGLPMFDTLFAIVRRLAHGQNPMSPDRGHIHHRLIDMGLNQKQAVAALYVVSSILGLSAVVLATSGAMRAMLFLAAVAVVAFLASRVIFPREIAVSKQEKQRKLDAAPAAELPAGGEDDEIVLHPAVDADGHDIDLHPAVDADRIEEDRPDGTENGGEA
ncbi:MAG: undecaprenyl/decaprenyl-phosphate alpha-N-acetylglucosaminyl 1-phosphate transferase [Ruminococcaceae bacterium]|nr:undecaprenyl/decaprenyl-phosphate alpha-N-acetylglucosaminyl 1-phosphate transferase [Oscillospiraceae bacterium]